MGHYAVSLIKRNLAANFFGMGWSGILIVAMVPVYVRLVGVEAYGIVAFYTAVQAVTVLLDLGLATAVNRQVARLSVSDEGRTQIRALVRTAEVFFWGGAFVLAGALFVAAPAIATKWFTLRQLSSEAVIAALRLMAIAIGFRFPYNLYSGVLLGLQRHVALNVVLSAAATVRFGGTLLVLLLIGRDIRVVFAWEVIAAAILVVMARVITEQRVPGVEARFEPGMLSHTWVFARGAAVIGILAAVATQIDKFAVSRMLPLETFGRYGVAVTMASAVVMTVSPVQATIFPRFSQLVADGARRELVIAYHRAAQTVSAIIVPIALIAAIFSRELVVLWTGDAALAASIRLLVALLVGGALFNGLLNVPYALQLAHGWTAPAIWLNAISVVAMIPLTIFAIWHFGALGAAACWLLMHSFQLVVSIILTMRHLLPGEFGRWAIQDVGFPAAAALAVSLICRAMTPVDSKAAMAVAIVVSGALAFAAAAATTPVVRDEWNHRRGAA